MTTNNPAHRRIACQTFSVIHVLVSGETTEHGLPQETRQHVSSVLAATTIRQHCAGKRGKTESVIQVTVGEQSRIGRDAGAVKFQLEAPVENELRNITVNADRPAD
jgi:hypothetical protein